MEKMSTVWEGKEKPLFTTYLIPSQVTQYLCISDARFPEQQEISLCVSEEKWPFL